MTHYVPKHCPACGTAHMVPADEAPPEPARPKVWIVTTGEYSSYEIISVWSTREAAEAYVAKRNALSQQADGVEWEAAVEEWDLDSPPLDRLANRVVVMDVFDEDGVSWSQRNASHPFPYEGLVYGEGSGEVQVSSHFRPSYDCNVVPNCMFLRVTGVDGERVRKVFSEQRARILAEWDAVTHDREVEP